MAKPSGEIYLIHNIPLDNTYEHTIKFNNITEQVSYFMSNRVKTYQYTTYIRKKESIRVGYLLDDIEDVNYVLYRSSSSSKWYFNFITGKKYLGENATELNLELDVMQTYQFDYELKSSFLERGHINRWEADKSPIFSYTDEKLDYGSEYVNEVSYEIKRPDGLMWFLCLMSHSQDFHEGVTAPSSMNDVPIPYVAYLIPHWLGDSSKSFKVTTSGITYDIANISQFMAFMGDSAVGKAVKEITYISYLPVNLVVESDGTIVNGTNGLTLAVDKLEAKDSWLDSVKEWFTGNDDASVNLLRIDAKNSSFDNIKSLVSFEREKGLDVLSSSEWTNILANSKTAKFDKRIESKLLTHPYRYNIFTNWKSEPLVIKNEYLPESITVKMSKALAFNNPARYWIEGYKQDVNGRGNSIIEASNLELPIVSDAYYEYQLQNKTQMNVALLSGIASTASSLGVGIATGGASLALGVGVAGNQAGDISSQLAKSNDIKNIPDSVINSKDCTLSIADKNLYLTFYRYKVNDEVAQRLANYWHIFGYKVADTVNLNEYISSRERFNYVKTTAVNIMGSFDVEDLITIKNNFNKGITFWHYYEDFKPLDYSLMNIEKSLK